MIDAFVKLIEKITEFVKLRHEAEKRAYELLVKPTFENLKTIHPDYLKFFQSCRDKIKRGEDLKEIADQFETDRLEYEPLRRSVAEFMRSYINNPRLKHYSDFFMAAYTYLCGAFAENTRSTTFFEHMDALAARRQIAADLAPGDQVLLDVIDEMLSDLRRNWEEVSREYAKLTADTALG